MTLINTVHGATRARKQQEPRPLRIVIIGAGIGGLTAAIALRSQGHEVTILERSRFAQELGAAIHLAPNANGILRRFAIFGEDFGANPTLMFNEYNANGERVKRFPTTPHLWQHTWLLAHRVRLHDALKTAATDPDREGSPAKLVLSCPVVEIDCENGIVVTQDGTKYQGDAVIGADGVHSVARLKIAPSIAPFDSGKNAFRFMMSRTALESDPLTAGYAKGDGELSVFYGRDRRVIMYPTNNNEEFNFGAFHPSTETNATGDDWTNQTTVEAMLEVFRSFHPSVQAILQKADPRTLKIWNLLDMDKLPTFVNQRLALIGDAAHPFLPHQGQGAGMAIEDAASLAVMLPRGVTPEEVSERLQLYNSTRYDRVHAIQHITRITGQDEDERAERVDMNKHVLYNFGHDEWDHSSQRLREFLWSRKPVYWRQPTAFGPIPGPRQDQYGTARVGVESTYRTASIKFKTSRTILQNLFPPGRGGQGFSFISPGTVAYASISQTTLGKMEWLGGSGYNHLGLYIHGVQYTMADGSVLKGAYLPVLFEDLTDPIVSGREELGMPKLYSTIDIQQRDGSYAIETGWQGATWGHFELTGLKEVDGGIQADKTAADDDSQADDGILLYRYMPKVGRAEKGNPSEEHAVFMPFKEERPAPNPLRSWTAADAKIKIDPRTLGVLPTLHHIIERLAEIPVYEIVSGQVVEGTGVSDVASACRIE